MKKEEIVEFIEHNNITGVVFITGDRHLSEIDRLTLNNGQYLYDITCSPILSPPARIGAKHEKNENFIRIENSLIAKRNFTKISVNGSEEDRKLNIDFFNKRGKLLFQYVIHENELQGTN